MLFFQSVPIGGYVYAHLLTRHVPVWAQIAIHLGLWGLALTCLPLALDAGWRYDAETSPALLTLSLFAAGVGLPFFVLSANAPLIQSWYARSDGPSSDDPTSFTVPQTSARFWRCWPFLSWPSLCSGLGRSA